jgi:hypothetical protein
VLVGVADIVAYDVSAPPELVVGLRSIGLLDIFPSSTDSRVQFDRGIEGSKEILSASEVKGGRDNPRLTLEAPHLPSGLVKQRA